MKNLMKQKRINASISCPKMKPEAKEPDEPCCAPADHQYSTRKIPCLMTGTLSSLQLRFRHLETTNAIVPGVPLPCLTPVRSSEEKADCCSISRRSCQETPSTCAYKDPADLPTTTHLIPHPRLLPHARHTSLVSGHQQCSLLPLLFPHIYPSMTTPTVLSPQTLLAHNPKLHLPASTSPPSDTDPPTQKTWLIFGATGHIGRSLVKSALSHGDNVAAVGRTMENTMKQMQDWHERCLGLLCDVRVRETVKEAVDACISRFGGLDIVVK